MSSNKLTPRDWQILTGTTIVDPDGWREGSPFGAKDFEEEIDYRDFIRRSMVSTVKGALNSGNGYFPVHTIVHLWKDHEDLCHKVNFLLSFMKQSGFEFSDDAVFTFPDGDSWDVYDGD